MHAVLSGIALAALIVASATAASAQEAKTFGITLQPARATVGDHLALTITIRHSPAAQLEAPGSLDDFAPLELIEVRPPDTRDVTAGLQETRFVYVLAAFQTGEVRPPPLRVAVHGAQDEVATLQPPAALIESVVSPGSPATLRDLKGPLVASTGTPSWVWGALLMAGFGSLTLLTMALARIPTLRRPAPLVASVGPAEEQADEAARRELSAIARAGLLDRGELTEYYRRIAACLRTYLTQRFAISAVAMTPQELQERLGALDVHQLPVRLAVNVLEQCQAVQFAGYEPARERAETVLSSAAEVVTLTSPSEPVSEQIEAVRS